MSYKYRHTLFAVLSTTAILLTASCSGNDDELSSDGRTILFGVETTTSSVQISRAGTDIDGELPRTVGIYGFNTTDGYEGVFDNQKLYYKNSEEAIRDLPEEVQNWPLANNWVYTPRQYWKEEKDYVFYAYAPYDDRGDATLYWNVGDGLFLFSRQNIAPVSAEDYMVASNKVVGRSTVMPRFVMQHLTARIRFSIKLHEEYLKMRDVVVTSMCLSDEAWDNASYYKCDKNLTIADSAPTLTAMGSKYAAHGDINLLPETPTRSGLLLTDSYQTFSSVYCMPVSLTDKTATLTVTYDVYDKNGVKTRSGQSTSNKIDLNGFGLPEAGRYYDMKVLVKPKYIYVLSDHDVQPDGWIDIE